MQIAARITAYRISNGALAAKDLPKRLKFLDWGDSESLKGTVRVSALTAERLPAIQAARGWDRIALDYEHNTLPGTPEFERSHEPRPVAAYGVVVCVPGDGLYLDDIQWTPHGEKFAREYVDLSPAPAQTSDGTVVGVHSVALCRHGSVTGLQFYSVNLNEGDAMKEMLCKMLGLPETATEEEIKKAFADQIKALSVEAVGQVPDLKPLELRLVALEKGSGDVAKIQALSAEVVTLTGKIAEMEKGILRRDRNDILTRAAREGKVVALSAEAIDKLSVTDLDSHVKALPVVVPLEQRTPDYVIPHSAPTGEEDAAIDRVARACGMDPAKVKGQKS
jgi:phage I-like protein